MFTAELFGTLIAWLLAAILLSLFLLMLVLIWGQIIQTLKVWFGLPGVPREPLDHPHEHTQVPDYPHSHTTVTGGGICHEQAASISP